MSEHLDRLDRERVMSESTARAERRDLRRAMGPHVQAFASDTKQAIQILQAGLDTERDERIADVARARTVAGATFNSLAEFCGRDLRGRLRWILTGK